MKIFNIKALNDWDNVKPGEVIKFDAVGVRQVRMTVNTSAKTNVYVANNKDMKNKVLVAAAEGIFECGYAATGPSYVVFATEPGEVVYVRGNARTQIVKSVSEEVYTSIIPHGRRNTEIDRILQLVKLNEMTRQQQMADELQQLRAEIQNQGKVVENVPNPDQGNAGNTAASSTPAPQAGDTAAT